MKNTNANDEGQPWHHEDNGKVTMCQLCWPNLYDNTLSGDEDHVAMSHVSMAAVMTSSKHDVYQQSKLKFVRCLVRVSLS